LDFAFSWYSFKNSIKIITKTYFFVIPREYFTYLWYQQIESSVVILLSFIEILGIFGILRQSGRCLQSSHQLSSYFFLFSCWRTFLLLIRYCLKFLQLAESAILAFSFLAIILFLELDLQIPPFMFLETLKGHWE